MENPLLHPTELPNFSDISPELIQPALKQIISQNRKELTELLSQSQPFTWANLLAPMEDMHDYLSKVWSPISHMHSVVETDALREAYNACLPILTEYNTEIMQNETLYKAVQSIADSGEYKKLDNAQRKVIDYELRDFKLAGVSLPVTDKARYAELQKQLSKLTTQFAENVLDATHGWTLHITDPNALKGLPGSTLKLAEETARNEKKPGWVLTLDFPCYSTVMKYLDNRELRWLMYEAYTTRASDQGPNAGRWDNTQIMEQILRTRYDVAMLLGFSNYAEYSLATKMAKSPQQVLNFLNDLVAKSKPAAEKEIAELKDYAKTHDNIDTLEAWDLAYYSEKLRQLHYSISQEDLRPYFPAAKVLSGMFEVVKRLYGLQIIERNDADVWHPQVKFFEVRDENNELRGYFYTDLYARPHKRDGAWMDECRNRRKLTNGKMQLPVAFLTCNFNRPIGDKPALLTHEDVITCFHEFGHCLHHLLTQVDYAAVSGINNVPWDAVEFPSQFFENWCWDKEAIKLISEHVETGDTLPDSLFNKMLAAKNFQPGMHMLRQLEFALFDFRLHLEYDSSKNAQVQNMIDDVRKKVSVFRTPTFNRFQHSFSHIFAGGYSAGYYSYEWADVLASDAFGLFEEKGIFDKNTGRAFMHNILEQGGAREPMDLFIAFRGREPKIDALLRHKGLVNESKSSS